MGWGDFVSSVTEPVRQVTSDIGSAASNAYKDLATSQNLALVNPSTALFSQSGRDALLSTYGQYAGSLSSFIPGGSAASGLAGNVLSQLPQDGSGAFLTNLLGGAKAPASQGSNANGMPIIISGGTPASTLPAWVLPAAVLGGAVVLALVLRK